MGMALLRWLAPFAMKGAAIAGVLLALWLYIGHVERSARASQKAIDGTAVREAQLQAKINAVEKARAVEAAYVQGTKDANDALLPAMDAANDSLARYLARLRPQADPGGAGRAGLPTTADAADIVDRADQAAVLADDLRICTENTVRLRNAQDWAWGDR